MSKRKVWSADVRVYATIYVIANTERAARKLMRQRLGDCIDTQIRDDVSGHNLDHPEMPEASFSPYMTVVENQRLSGFGLIGEYDVES